MKTTLATLAALLTLVAAGCGGGTTEAEGITSEAAAEDAATEGEPAEASRCLHVGGSLKKAIASGLTVKYGGWLGKAAAVRSDDFERVWYVSAVILGPAIGAETVGTWAVNVKPDAKYAGGLIIAADSVAREFSDWGEAAAEGSPVAEVRGLENDGAQESRDCLEA
jgi:hypothetical protein